MPFTNAALVSDGAVYEAGLALAVSTIAAAELPHGEPQVGTWAQGCCQGAGGASSWSAAARRRGGTAGPAHVAQEFPAAQRGLVRRALRRQRAARARARRHRRGGGGLGSSAAQDPVSTRRLRGAWATR
eukprot:6895444-Pyramimonas_sp.AAC.1